MAKYKITEKGSLFGTRQVGADVFGWYKMTSSKRGNTRDIEVKLGKKKIKRKKKK